MGTTRATDRLQTPANRTNATIAWSAATLFALAGAPLAIGQGAPQPRTTPAETTRAGGEIAPTGGSSGGVAGVSGEGNGKMSKPATRLGRNGEKAAKRAQVDDQMVVDLHVQDEDLANVLEMLSIQSQKNIIASKNVSARITANLYGVTFYEALDAILHANGYGYVEKGNFIYVYTLEELEQIEAANRTRASRIIKLNYLNAVDAAEFVKPLLSDGGQIKTNGKTANFPQIAETPIGGDDFTNGATLVIFDFDENIAEVENMLKSLDTKPAQVLVEATILQTALNEANAFGVDFSLIADLNFQDFVQLGGPLQATNGLIRGATTNGGSTPLPADGTGRAITSSPGNTAGPGTMKLGLVQDDVAVFMRLLDEVTDTTILSNPKILSLNRMPSRVLVGRKVGYLSTTSTDTTTTQTVQFLNTGTQLYFRPFVTNEGMIRMELKPQVSEAQIRDTRDSTGAAVTIPDEITNELVTNVIVGDGQTIVLGGLFRESTTSTRRQVPLLGDIPVVGLAFRGHDDATARSEIIFLITPNIVNDQVLATQGQRALSGVERVRTGAREGTLFWSRDKLTGIFNVEADKLAQDGQTDKALWKLQQSLWMNPGQQEAIALRERITGQTKPLPGRSLLDDIVRGEAISRTRKSSDAGTSGDTPATQAFVEGSNTPATFETSPLTASDNSNSSFAASDTTTTNNGDTATGTSGTTNAVLATATSPNTTSSSNTNFTNATGATFNPGVSGGRFSGLIRWTEVVASAPANWTQRFTNVTAEPAADGK